MTAEAIREYNDHPERQADRWFEAFPFDNNFYFYKLNENLKAAGLSYRWWVVKNQDSSFVYAQGLWTRKEIVSFIKNIEWNRGRFTLPSVNYKTSQCYAYTTYSCMIPNFVLKELVDRRVLMDTETLQNGANFRPHLTVMEKVLNILDQDYTVNVQRILEQPGMIWFNLTTKATPV